ncbi:MAG: ABC transporter permease [Bacteroidota bacterium]
MYILRLAFSRILSNPGNSILSLLLFAIGGSIISFLILANQQIEKGIKSNLANIDLVIGAKGSPLQLILSSVLHADYPTGNISLDEAERLGQHPFVEKYIPLALGDNYQGFRIVGAPTSYPQLYNERIAEGQWYENSMEVVLGYQVARETGLQTGDTFYGVHGFQKTGHAHKNHIYTVKGVLAYGANIADNLIFTPVESVWQVHDHHHDHNKHEHRNDNHSDHDHNHSNHDHKNHDHKHDSHTNDQDTHEHNISSEHDHQQSEATNTHKDQHIQGVQNTEKQKTGNASDNEDIIAIQQKIDDGQDISREEMELYRNYMQENTEKKQDSEREITAMLLFYGSQAAHIQLPSLINEISGMQAASPALQLNRLMKLLGFGFDMLRLLAWVIIVISGINIFVNLLSHLRQLMGEIALIRVLGASSLKVFLLLLYQGVLLAVGGWAVAVLLSRMSGSLLPGFAFLQNWFSIPLQTNEWFLLLYMIATGMIAALIPAIKAYNTDVHFTLTKNTHV